MTWLVDKVVRLQKFPGKGGWTYADIPEIKSDRHAPFGWVEVRGYVDDHPLEYYKLMPKGDGQMFLPVKAEVRKKIGKQAGDEVHIRLKLEDSELVVPEDIQDCIDQEGDLVKQRFSKLSRHRKKYYLDWINEAKRDETKVERIAEMIGHLEKGD
jgi:hypothetical protein